MWDNQDSSYLLHRKWLEAFRDAKGLVDAYDKAYRPQDTEVDLLRKLVRSYAEFYAVSVYPTNQDNEIWLYRKILEVLNEGEPLPDSADYAWRPMDDTRDLVAKILRAHYFLSGETDPRKSFMPLDSVVRCLQKIVALQ